jgi:hypothetical protein
MLEPSAKRMLTRSLHAGLLGWAVSLAALPTLSLAAESLPASVRACAAETDSLKRLICYDREVARFPEPKATAPTAKSQPAPSTAGGSSANSAAVSAAAPTAPPAIAAYGNSTSDPTAAPPSSKPATPDKPGRVTARIVSIDRSPNEMVLHLDNGQVWQQQQAVVGDLSLKTGDNVTIDKRLGSYWLTGPHVSGMKVRQTN